MRKTIGLVAILVVMTLGAIGTGEVASAEPETAPVPEHNGTLTATCEGVTGLLTNFPQGVNEVTIDVDGDETDLEFTGPAGSVFLPWDFSAGGSHQISMSWSADGGGSVGPITFDADECMPPPTTAPPPTTTEPPPPTTEAPPPTTAVPPPPTTEPSTTPPCDVNDPRPGCPHELARTGGMNWPLTGLGIFLILGGYLAMRAKRRAES